MTMLSIVQAIAEEVGVTSPTTVAGSQDRTARQLLRLVNRAGKALARKPWPILQTEYVFSTAANVPGYDLPADFAELLPDTTYDKTFRFKMLGGVTPQEWQRVPVALSLSTLERFRIKAYAGSNLFFIDPTPTAVDQMAFEYLTTQWVRSSADEPKEEFTSDNDRSLLPDELLELSGIWRFRNAKGLAYLQEFNDFNKQLEAIFGSAPGYGMLNLGMSTRTDASGRGDTPSAQASDLGGMDLIWP